MWLLSGKVVLLSMAYMLCFIIANALAVGPFLAGNPSATLPPEQAGMTLLAILVVSILNTLVVTHVVLRSCAVGWKLSGAVFLLLYGAMTFMAQIETLAFPAVANRLPTGMVWGLFLMGLLIAAPVSVLTVRLLGKWNPEGLESPNPLLAGVGWGWKLPLIAVLYAVLYFSFGYYVAWRTPAVASYYGGSDPGSFLLQLRNVMRDTPWLPFFQLLRGMLWLGLALPVIRMMKAPVWEVGLAIGLGFAVLMNSQHLLPNPFMPDAVRYAHLLETASSNLLFGFLMVLILAVGQRKALEEDRTVR